MEFHDVEYTVDAGIARITLDKPEKMNALSWGTMAEIEKAAMLANDDDDVRCVVVTGRGRGFCAGTDLTVREPEGGWHRGLEGRAAKLRTRFLGPAAIYDCRKPTIAAVNGAAVGAGFSVALATDIRIASESARFSAIFTKRGLSADTGTSWFLPRLVGMERALEVLYTGRFVMAEEALRIGLVSEVVPADRLMARVDELAAAIANGPTLAIEINKRLARESMTRSLSEHVEFEQFLQQTTQGTEDAREGRLSFLEKREPVFKGR